MKQKTSLSQAHRGFVAIALASLTATLVGCSGEPSAGDVDKTVRFYMSESQTQLQKLSGTRNTLGEIHDLKKIDMTQAGNRTKTPASFRFVKGSAGWALAR